METIGVHGTGASAAYVALQITMTTNTLIKSKLRPPVIGRDTVARERLLNRLDYHRPLTLVVAPAGYGKTTLVVNWVTHARHPYAWLALDAYDDSLTAFTTYMLAALETVFPNAFPETHAFLNNGALPASTAVAQTLVNELEALPHGVVLVLDDYHAIHDPAIHQLMADLLRYQPRTLELVLLARYDPPLQVADLRLHNRITELRAEELRFSFEESKTLLQKVAGAPMDDRQAATLAEMTEGWPAGVRMAALLLEQYGEVSKVVANLETSEYSAAKHLVATVFDRMDPGLQAFLLQTTHMEQVCAPLCAAVIGGVTVEQCQANLEALTQQNLFVFALDAKGAWYRYHHLFRTVLQHRVQQTLAAAEIAALHGRAGGWLAANGQIDAAIAHAVKAGDVRAVADLVRDHRNERLNADDWAALETWRTLIPRAMLQQHPQLLILDAWSFSRRALFSELSRCLDEITRLPASAAAPADEMRLLGSELDVMRTQLLYWAGDSEGGIVAGRRALREAPLDYAYARSAARVFLSGALETLSQDEADELLAAGLREARQHLIGSGEAREIHPTGLLCWMRADMARMEEIANRMLALAQERGSLEYVAWSRYLRACAGYQQNDLAGAQRDFSAVLESSFSARPFAYSQSFFGLAATYQAQGKADQAGEYARQGVNYAEESGNAVMLARAEGFLAHLSLRQGKVDAALRWLAQPCRIPPTMPIPTFHATLVGRAAILLGCGGDEARHEADELLLRLCAHVERYRNTRFLIEVLALQAYSLDCAGDKEAALDLLERAVLLTVPGETIRALADLDHLIDPLLAQLAARSSVRSQVTRIRRAAAVSSAAAGAVGPASHNGSQVPQHPGAPLSPVSHPDLLEPFTFREMDVLLLLQDRPSNKEIAQHLNITTETVKRHLSNIYRKLHVQSRRQALAQARAMGILPRK